MTSTQPSTGPGSPEHSFWPKGKANQICVLGLLSLELEEKRPSFSVIELRVYEMEFSSSSLPFKWGELEKQKEAMRE